VLKRALAADLLLRLLEERYGKENLESQVGY
jgi:hypothetical protein